MFNPLVRYTPNDVTFKYPKAKEDFPWAIDSENQHLVDSNSKIEKVKRLEKRNAPDGKVKKTGNRGFLHYLHNHMFDNEYMYQDYFPLMKDNLFGELSLFHPDITQKLLPHDVTQPEQYKEGTIIEENQYATNPITADIIPDLPPYYDFFTQIVNYTDENKSLLRKSFCLF